MGLDMYLTGKQFIWTSNDKEPFKSRKGLQKVLESKFLPCEITFELGYWRKSNQIHSWFVKNVQANKDDCGDYIVNKEDLNKLLETVNSVLKDHSLAETVLPSQSGFFFGNTDYDKWYFDDLEDTKKILETVLNTEECNSMDIYYHSSW